MKKMLLLFFRRKWVMVSIALFLVGISFVKIYSIYLYQVVIYMRIYFCPEVTLFDADADLQTMLQGVEPVRAHPSVKLNATRPHTPSAPALGYLMDEEERVHLLQLLVDFNELFTAANITFVMIHGLLIGSCVTHGVLPWDDDADIIVAYRDLPKIKRLFRDPQVWVRYGLHTYHEEGLENLLENEYALERLQEFPQDAPDGDFYRFSYRDTTSATDHKFKFFYSGSPFAGIYPWRWPFIDVAIYKEDSNIIWTLDFPSITVPVNTFYPIVHRPLETIWFPAPHSPEYFLATRYRKFRCVQSDWSHKSETWMGRKGTCCGNLASYYPLVWKVPYQHGQTLEILVLNGTVIRALIFPVAFRSKHFGF